MTQIQVEQTLKKIIGEAEEGGESSIIVISGELNKKLPYTNEVTHSYWPMCCKAMDKVFNTKTDKVIRTSDSGQTSQYIIQYSLPRNPVIDDSELSNITSNSNVKEYDLEEEYNKIYPKKYVTEIGITVQQWKQILINSEIFHESDVQEFKKIYAYPHHAVTCKELANSEGKAPQSYIKPVVALARRIKEFYNLSPIYGTDGKETFWRILFWGRYLYNTLFEWKIRPELASAMVQLWPELDIEIINKVEDARYIEEVSTNSIEKLPVFSDYD